MRFLYKINYLEVLKQQKMNTQEISKYLQVVITKKKYMAVIFKVLSNLVRFFSFILL